MTRAIVGLFGLACLVLLVSSKPVAGQGPVKKIKNSVGMELAEIPTGKFIMGSPPPGKDKQSSGKDAHEAEPAHEVTLTRPISMGVFEVTQREFATVMGGDNSSHFQGAALLRLLGQKTRSSQYPVEQVDHADAKKFCARLSALPAEKAAGRVYRLPTEAEWEFACRAGSKTSYCFGEDETDLRFSAWFLVNANEMTHPVGLKAPNAWGLHDMHGNVWEWCADWQEKYPLARVTDPLGPEMGSHRICRGGAWANPVLECRSAARYWLTPASRNNTLGFRVAMESTGAGK